MFQHASLLIIIKIINLVAPSVFNFMYFYWKEFSNLNILPLVYRNSSSLWLWSKMYITNKHRRRTTGGVHVMELPHIYIYIYFGRNVLLLSCTFLYWLDSVNWMDLLHLLCSDYSVFADVIVLVVGHMKCEQKRLETVSLIIDKVLFSTQMTTIHGAKYLWLCLGHWELRGSLCIVSEVICAT